MTQQSFKQNFTSNLARQFTPRMSTLILFLLPHQRHLLQFFRHSEHFVILRTDKNLGPAIIERDVYIRRAFSDHLSDSTTYRKLTEVQKDGRLNAVRRMITNFIHRAENANLLPPSDITFLKRSLQHCADPLAQFYILAKIHKTPWATRPICSVSGSLLHGIGRWIDAQLQPICQLLPSFVQSSFKLKEALLSLPPIPPTAQLFTADAVSMYTNIDTHHALTQIESFLTAFPYCIDNDINVSILMEALTLVMTHNLFQFGDTYWIQLTGTAMGSPPAPMYATLYYAIHEYHLLQRYSSSLLFYRRYIDDVIGIWLPDVLNDFSTLQTTMSFGKLHWIVSPRATQVDFLDITITLTPSHGIETRLFEKALNLYLYLPPHSCHPSGVLKGLITGLLVRITRLTSNQELHIPLFRTVFHRLLRRGYTKEHIFPLFLKAIQRVYDQSSLLPTKVDEKLIFLHLPYHTDDVPSTTIQRLFKETLKAPNSCLPYAPPYDRLIIAYHRQKNLTNLLCPRKFGSTPGRQVSAVLGIQ
jgi:hypothetical protein